MFQSRAWRAASFNCPGSRGPAVDQARWSSQTGLAFLAFLCRWLLHARELVACAATNLFALLSHAFYLFFFSLLPWVAPPWLPASGPSIPCLLRTGATLFGRARRRAPGRRRPAPTTRARRRWTAAATTTETRVAARRRGTAGTAAAAAAEASAAASVAVAVAPAPAATRAAEAGAAVEAAPGAGLAARRRR